MFLRITSWIQRFLHNCKRLKSERKSGPLTTKEIESSEILWAKALQIKIQDTPQFKDDAEKLNLQLDGTRRFYICKGRITCHYPIYISSNTLMSKKLVAHAHLKNLHGRVGYTMAEVRERFWIPKLRQLTKRVMHECYGCKGFRAVACPAPAVGDLPLDCTSGSRQFQVIGIDLSLIYIKKGKQEEKTCILVYSCSLTRAVYMDLMRDQSPEEFLISLPRFTARRGRPEKFYSVVCSSFKMA